MTSSVQICNWNFRKLLEHPVNNEKCYILASGSQENTLYSVIWPPQFKSAIEISEKLLEHPVNNEKRDILASEGQENTW